MTTLESQCKHAGKYGTRTSVHDARHAVEQRLVLLARAFVKDPELLILDEPLHGLDNHNRRLVKDIIEAFCKRNNKTMIMVTHYKEELPACIDHSIFLKRHA